AARAYPWPRRGRAAARRGLAPAGGRCLLPRARDGPAQPVLHPGPAVLPVDDGEGPGRPARQPGTAAGAAARTPRRGHGVLLARRRRVRAPRRAAGGRAGGPAGALRTRGRGPAPPRGIAPRSIARQEPLG